MRNIRLTFILWGIILPLIMFYAEAPLSTLAGLVLVAVGFQAWDTRGGLLAMGWFIAAGMILFSLGTVELLEILGDALILLAVVVTVKILQQHWESDKESSIFSYFSRTRQKRRVLERIINRSPAVALIWKSQDDFKVEYVSENIKQFGYRPKELTSGRITFGQLLYPDDQERVRRELALHEEKQSKHFVLTYRIFTSDGEVRWIKDWTWSEYDARGRCVRYEGIILDITRRLEAEEALAEEKERLHTTLRSIGDGVIATDAEGKVSLINGVAEEITGWPEEEAVGKPLNHIFQLINEQTGAVMENPVSKVLSTGEACELASHTALIDRDGNSISIADSAAPIRTDQDEITGVVLVFRDVTALKKIEAEKSRLMKEMKKNLEESLALQRITSALLEQISLDDILEIVCSESIRVTDSRVGKIYLLPEDQELPSDDDADPDLLKLVCQISEGEKEAAILPVSDLLLQVLRKGEPEIICQKGRDEAGDGSMELLAVPLLAVDRRLGVLTVTGNKAGFKQSDLKIMDLIAAQAAVAIKNANLYQDVQELAVLKERQRLARDLHDAVSQTLFSASLIADALPSIWEKDREEGRRRLAEIRNLSRGALSEMRTLLLELRPDGLVEADLGELLKHLVNALQSRSRVAVELSVEEKRSLPSSVQVAFYRIAQESLNNVNKHSAATELEINALLEHSEAQMVIRDNGRGFIQGEGQSEGLGLKIMNERAKEVGAQLMIDSCPGRGTEVSIAWHGEE